MEFGNDLNLHSLREVLLGDISEISSVKFVCNQFLYLGHSTFYSQMKQSAVGIVCMEENVISWYTLGFSCVITISVLTVEDIFLFLKITNG